MAATQVLRPRWWRVPLVWVLGLLLASRLLSVAIGDLASWLEVGLMVLELTVLVVVLSQQVEVGPDGIRGRRWLRRPRTVSWAEVARFEGGGRTPLTAWTTSGQRIVLLDAGGDAHTLAQALETARRETVG